MATELIKKTIDGEEYEFEQFGAKQSLRVLMRLSKLVGKPLLLSLKDKKKGEAFDFGTLAQAAQVLFDGLDEVEVLGLVETLAAEKVICNGKKVTFDSHYEGKLGHLLNVISAALEVQYGNFFSDLLDKADSAKGLDLTREKRT